MGHTYWLVLLLSFLTRGFMNKINVGDTIKINLPSSPSSHGSIAKVIELPETGTEGKYTIKISGCAVNFYLPIENLELVDKNSSIKTTQSNQKSGFGFRPSEKKKKETENTAKSNNSKSFDIDDLVKYINPDYLRYHNKVGKIVGFYGKSSVKVKFLHEDDDILPLVTSPSLLEIVQDS